MRMPHAPSSSELAALEAFLADPARPEGTLSLDELYGFLFAVTSAPDMVPMPEIFEFVFGDLTGVFATVDEADEVLGWIGGLYNQINAGVLERSPKLPARVAFREAPMDNFDPECPVSKWAQGFVAGHNWLEDAWELAMESEMEDELLSVLFILSLFASRERADDYDQHRRPGEPPLEATAGTAARLFLEAMESYAAMGRDIYEASMEAEHEPAIRDPVPGRNDPCPCGSGRKYKKCCGANVH